MVLQPTEPALSDPVAIVTGGAYGVGREIAQTLAGRGYSVVVAYLRDQREAEAAVEAILAASGVALAVRADVTDELDVERLFEETVTALGGVDVVVHTAIRGASVVYRQAALRLSHAGTIVNVSSSEAIPPALADQLRTRDITVNGVTPGLESPGANHDVAELVGFLDRWRRTPGG